jgi:hypothetical protein
MASSSHSPGVQHSAPWQPRSHPKRVAPGVNSCRFPTTGRYLKSRCSRSPGRVFSWRRTGARGTVGRRLRPLRSSARWTVPWPGPIQRQSVRPRTRNPALHRSPPSPPGPAALATHAAGDCEAPHLPGRPSHTAPTSAITPVRRCHAGRSSQGDSLLVLRHQLGPQRPIAGDATHSPRPGGSS